MNLTVEEALRQAEDRAAMLRFLAESAAAGKVDAVPEPPVLSGIGDACGEIERLVRAARRSLDVRALGTELKRQA